MKPLTEMGRYAALVVDPPWPLKKTGARKTRPNQAGHGDLGYAPMSLKEIASLPISHLLLSDAFVFLWTTQKFLPDAFGVIESWGLRYRFTLVWEKNTGPKPFNYPYSNAEFIVVGSTGSPKFVEESGFKAVFYAPVKGHSVKPTFFYETLSRITQAPRLDVFSRRHITGFDSWGDEAPHVQSSYQISPGYDSA